MLKVTLTGCLPVSGVPQLQPVNAAPAAPVPQMIPIAMLAELQRLMAHNAAMAANGNKPPGSLPFNPYELLAHGVHSSSLPSTHSDSASYGVLEWLEVSSGGLGCLSVDDFYWLISCFYLQQPTSIRMEARGCCR